MIKESTMTAPVIPRLNLNGHRAVANAPASWPGPFWAPLGTPMGIPDGTIGLDQVEAMVEITFVLFWAYGLWWSNGSVWLFLNDQDTPGCWHIFPIYWPIALPCCWSTPARAAELLGKQGSSWQSCGPSWATMVVVNHRQHRAWICKSKCWFSHSNANHLC